MAQQTVAETQHQPHGGVVPFNVMAYSLSDAICRVGVPTLEIGLAAAKSGLIRIEAGEGTMHFEWDKAALDQHSIKFLEHMLLSLRKAAGMAQ